MTVTPVDAMSELEEDLAAIRAARRERIEQRWSLLISTAILGAVCWPIAGVLSLLASMSVGSWTGPKVVAVLPLMPLVVIAWFFATCYPVMVLFERRGRHRRTLREIARLEDELFGSEERVAAAARHMDDDHWRAEQNPDWGPVR